MRFTLLSHMFFYCTNLFFILIFHVFHNEGKGSLNSNTPSYLFCHSEFSFELLSSMACAIWFSLAIMSSIFFSLTWSHDMLTPCVCYWILCKCNYRFVVDVDLNWSILLLQFLHQVPEYRGLWKAEEDWIWQNKFEGEC